MRMGRTEEPGKIGFCPGVYRISNVEVGDEARLQTWLDRSYSQNIIFKTSIVYMDSLGRSEKQYSWKSPLLKSKQNLCI